MVIFLPKQKLLCQRLSAHVWIAMTNVGHAQDFSNEPLKFIVGFPVEGVILPDSELACGYFKAIEPVPPFV
jgi:hypothetical protein